MATPTAPLNVPATSPIRSLQKVETRSALRISLIACLAPDTRLEAIAWKGASSPAVAATPRMSKSTPTRIIKNSNTMLNARGKYDNTLLLPKLSMMERTKVISVKESIDFHRFFISFFLRINRGEWQQNE